MWCSADATTISHYITDVVGVELLSSRIAVLPKLDRLQLFSVTASNVSFIAVGPYLYALGLVVSHAIISGKKRLSRLISLIIA